MIDGLRPYPEMKASGIEWLPILPNGWEIHRAKYSFQEADDRSESGGEELLSVSHKTGVTPRSQKNITMFMAESYEGHKVCRPGDIVVNTMWAWMAAIGVSRHVGIVSPAYGVYRPRTAERFEPKFLDDLLRTEAYRAEYLRSSRGVTTSRLRLYPPDFLNIPFVQPPLDEQRLIVRFLDWHGAQTAKLVRAKKKIIALLNEQKQAIIHRAVTRGLDPNAKLKPSGIPWLGDVLEGWEVKRAKYVFKIIDIRSETGAEELLTVSSRKGVVRRSTQTVTMFMAASYIGHKLCWPNDLVINSLWAWANGLGFSQAHGIVSTAYSVYRLLPTYSQLWQYLDYALRSGVYEREFQVRSKGIWISRLQLSDQSFLNMPLLLPNPAEAVAICQYIRRETATLDMAISDIEREITFIQEFRARLIADVVTGKLDVRAAAASLPEVTEIEPVDDSGEGDDLDESIDDAENEEVAA